MDQERLERELREAEVVAARAREKVADTRRALALAMQTHDQAVAENLRGRIEVLRLRDLLNGTRRAMREPA